MTASPSLDRNPYRPGAAAQPLYLAGRDAEMRRFAAVLRGAPELPANVRITGLRGVGKSVLLKELENISTKDGWITSRFEVEPRHNNERAVTELVAGLADQAALRASKLARLRRRVRDAATAARGAVRITYEDVEFSLDPSGGERQKDIVKALIDAATAAVDHGYDGYLLMLDEAQLIRDETGRGGDYPLSLLIAAVNAVQQHPVRMGLVLCGLPTLRPNLQRARTYSERMFRGEEIGRLADTEARDAFVRPLDESDITVEEPLVNRVVREVDGYPYFIQLWGAEMWEAARLTGADRFDEALLNQVEPEIYQRLDRDFYEGRVEALTPAEQDLLMATANCPYPPLRTSDIHAQSEKTEKNVNVLMGRLADQGVIYRIQKGVYEYTAPRFHDFLKRRRDRLAVS